MRLWRNMKNDDYLLFWEVFLLLYFRVGFAGEIHVLPLPSTLFGHAGFSSVTFPCFPTTFRARWIFHRYLLQPPNHFPGTLEPPPLPICSSSSIVPPSHKKKKNNHTISVILLSVLIINVYF